MNAIEASKTQQLYLLLRERIVSGSLRPGERLPGEPRLAAAHRMSRVTIRRALDGLAKDGLITRQPGSGTYVRESVQEPVITGDFANMMQSLIAMGKATRVKLISFGYVEPSAALRETLELAAGETVQHSIRVRYMDGEPFSYLSTHVPAHIGLQYSEADLGMTPLLTLLERTGVVVASAEQILSATLAGPDTAAALDVAVGSPLISMTRIVRDAEDQLVEHLVAFYRPDKHQFRMSLSREGEGTDRRWRPQTSGVSTASFTPLSGRRGTRATGRRP